MTERAPGAPTTLESSGGFRAPESDAGGAVAWTYNPWRERPGSATLAAVAALGMCLGVMRLDQPLVMTAALCFAAVGSMSPMLSPAGCRLDEAGVALKGPLGWRRRSWSEIARGRLLARGLMVSPYARPHWLDATRGLFLPLPSGAREALIASIRPQLARHGL